MLNQVDGRLKDKGLCALVYTQITDVETESNGLMTYDRAVFKVDPEKPQHHANRGEGKRPDRGCPLCDGARLGAPDLRRILGNRAVAGEFS